MTRALVAFVLVLLATGALAAPQEQTLAGWSVEGLAEPKARMEQLRTDVLQAPQEMRDLAARTRGALMSPAGVAVFTYVVILLLVGIGIEWLYWTYAFSAQRAIQSTAPASRPHGAGQYGTR